MLEVIHGDFLNIEGGLPKYDCVFADPPDNIGLEYSDSEDSLPDHEYLIKLEAWLLACMKHSPIVWWSFNARWTLQMGEIASSLLRWNDTWTCRPCVQVFSFGQHNHKWLGNNHRPLWCFYEVGAEFYPDAIRIPSWRQVHGDSRADPRGRVPGDVFPTYEYRSTKPIPEISLDLAKNILDRVEQKSDNECWPWKGGTWSNGYGRVCIGHERYKVTRVIWRIVHGYCPGDLLILHSCDNPICCNPKHLFLGSSADNSRDMVDKGRQNSPLGERHGHSKLSEREVYDIFHYESGTMEAIGNKYGVSASLICSIKAGKVWKHITQPENVFPGDVFDFPRVTGNSKQRQWYHPTQLNEELVERCIGFSTSPPSSDEDGRLVPSARVLDPFIGSGTTLRVCKKLIRTCTGIDISREYCENIADVMGLVSSGTSNRWDNLTSK